MRYVWSGLFLALAIVLMRDATGGLGGIEWTSPNDTFLERAAFHLPSILMGGLVGLCFWAVDTWRRRRKNAANR